MHSSARHGTPTTTLEKILKGKMRAAAEGHVMMTVCDHKAHHFPRFPSPSCFPRPNQAKTRDQRNFGRSGGGFSGGGLFGGGLSSGGGFTGGGVQRKGPSEMGCRVLGFGFRSVFWGRKQKQNKNKMEREMSKNKKKVKKSKKIKQKKKRKRERRNRANTICSTSAN